MSREQRSLSQMLEIALTVTALVPFSACAGTTPEPEQAQRLEPRQDAPYYVERDTEPRLVNGREIEGLLGKELPARLRRAGVEGKVGIWIFVNKYGEVTDKRLDWPSPSARYNKAALDLVERMQFTPAKRNGEPVGVWTYMPISYSTRVGR